MTPAHWLLARHGMTVCVLARWIMIVCVCVCSRVRVQRGHGAAVPESARKRGHHGAAVVLRHGNSRAVGTATAVPIQGRYSSPWTRQQPCQCKGRYSSPWARQQPCQWPRSQSVARALLQPWALWQPPLATATAVPLCCVVVGRTVPPTALLAHPGLTQRYHTTAPPPPCAQAAHRRRRRQQSPTVRRAVERPALGATHKCC